MGKIRKSGQGGVRRGGGLKNLDPAQRRERRAARLKKMANHPGALRMVEDMERRARGRKLNNEDMDELIGRAMKQDPASDAAGAFREAAAVIVENLEFDEKAQPQAEALKKIVDCRDGGSMSKAQTVDMIQDMIDRSGGKITDEASKMIKYAAWSNGDIMDAESRGIVGRFLTAWYEDQVESGLVAEGRRQLEAQLAQDKRDFTDFMSRDKTEHKRKTYDEFKHDLQENRVDSSDWQTLMIWLQTGLKKNPITN